MHTLPPFHTLLSLGRNIQIPPLPRPWRPQTLSPAIPTHVSIPCRLPRHHMHLTVGRRTRNSGGQFLCVYRAKESPAATPHPRKEETRASLFSFFTSENRVVLAVLVIQSQRIRYTKTVAPKKHNKKNKKQKEPNISVLQSRKSREPVVFSAIPIPFPTQLLPFPKIYSPLSTHLQLNPYYERDPEDTSENEAENKGNTKKPDTAR